MKRYGMNIFLLLALFVYAEAEMFASFIERAKTIGRQTPVDIVLYAKNPSKICRLTITYLTNPYKRDLSRDKLEPIILEPGRYIREDVHRLLKGTYEFEYRWDRGDIFVDSGLRTIYLLAYHDTTLPFHKKIDLTFVLRLPDGCGK